jgi:hypothetical protein
MNRIAVITVLLCVIGNAGCSNIHVDVDYDDQFDFTRYKTYRWITPEEGEADRPPFDPFVRKQIKNNINTELEKKGYEHLEFGRPDFLVFYHVASRNRVDIHYYGYHYGYWWGPPYATAHRYKEGTLIIDIVDREEKELVWRGYGTTDFQNREEAKYKMPDVVRKILGRFPPK